MSAIMNHVASCLMVAVLAMPLSASAAQGNVKQCGVERWPVKIAVDADAARMDTVIRRITVTELASLPAPATLPQRQRVAPYELRTYRVIGIVRETRNEDDGDIHVILGDIENSDRTI